MHLACQIISFAEEVRQCFVLCSTVEVSDDARD